MKKLLILLIFMITIGSYSQEPTDCVNAIVICGNSTLNLDVAGFGIQEIAGLGCSSQENNSLWLELTIYTGGTLGFNLTPESTDIIEDYDFWVFGPDVSCGNLGLPIRCSTTNPQMAGQGDNLTGMNGTSTDISEGPGPDGDSFVQWLDVLQDEVYYIIIDRPHGNSGFSLEWTGTASLGIIPTNQAPEGSLDYITCDTEFPYDDGQVSINLEDNSAAIIGTQTNVSVTYHANETDATLGNSPLVSPYTNTLTNETIYIRITSDFTECFSVSSFDLTILPGPSVNNISHVECDEDGVYDGFTLFDLNTLNSDIVNETSPTTVEYFLTSQNAIDNTNPIVANTFVNTSSPQILYTRVTDDTTGCYSLSEVELQVSAISLQNYQVPAVCDEVNSEDGLNTFDLNQITTDISGNLPANATVTYYETLDNALNQTNPLATPYTNTVPYSQTIIARADDPFECYDTAEIAFTINVLPQLEEDELTYYCLNFYPETITLESGNLDSNLGDYSYEWSTGEITEFIEVNQPGDYTITVTNNLNCSQTRTITVEASNIATIEDILVIDGSLSFENTVTVNVSGEGIYEYALFNELGAYRYYQASNVFEHVVPGFYTVYVKDVKNDCGIVEQLISVIGFPKYFTPNSDGYKDTWQVYGISEQFQPNSKILIFDRYGKLLKQLDPLGKGWDGTFNGQPLPNSDYWFAVTLQDGRIFKSHFALKR